MAEYRAGFATLVLQLAGYAFLMLAAFHRDAGTGERQ